MEREKDMDIVNKALKKEYTTYLMVGAILVISLLNVLFAEKIQVRGGLGFDGKFYGDIAANFVERVTEQQLSAYRIQRIVPSGIIYGVFSLFKIPLSVPNIIKGFEFLNVFLLAISAWAWGLIANELKISTKGKWLGFIALFVNFCFLKHNAYYPVLTDTTAFTLGMFMLLAYLKDMPIVLWMLTFIGAFTWPTLLYCGILLIIFPRKPALPERNLTPPLLATSSSQNNGLYLPAIVAGVLAVIWMGGSSYYHYFLQHIPVGADGWPGDTSMGLEFVNLSILIVGIYVFLATKPLVLAIMTNRFNFTYFFSSSWLIRLISCLFIFIIVRFLIEQLSHPGDLLRWYIKGNFAYAISKPFVFGVTHVMYYGPIIFTMAFLLKQCSNYVVQHGLGISLLWLIGILMAIRPESRHLINLFPIFVLFTSKVLEDLPLTKRFYLTFLIISFLLSQVYVTINTGLEVSFWRWFQGKSYLISDEMYLAQGIILLFIVFFFYFEFFNKPPFTNRNINIDKEIA
jgi:hypothetical protein